VGFAMDLLTANIPERLKFNNYMYSKYCHLNNKDEYEEKNPRWNNLSIILSEAPTENNSLGFASACTLKASIALDSPQMSERPCGLIHSCEEERQGCDEECSKRCCGT
jgi:hypothetical protein